MSVEPQLKGNMQGSRDTDIKSPTSWRVYYLLRKIDMQTNTVSYEVALQKNEQWATELVLHEVPSDDGKEKVVREKLVEEGASDLDPSVSTFSTMTWIVSPQFC